MTALAPTLEAFFTDRLIRQRQVSTHSVIAYRDTFRLLLGFVQTRTGRTPSTLNLEDLDAALISAFLDHLEVDRHNKTRTRNARLAAVHSLFRFAALRHPENSALIQRVLAMPPKRYDRTIVAFLDRGEVDALLAAPDRGRWIGRRDHAVLLLAVQTGLRVSELTALTNQDVHLGPGAHIRCTGKGRKERCTPLTAETVGVLRAWMHERGGQPTDALFHTSTADHSAAMQWRSSPPGTPGLPLTYAHRCVPRWSHRTACATPQPCGCSRQESTLPPSTDSSVFRSPW